MMDFRCVRMASVLCVGLGVGLVAWSPAANGQAPSVTSIEPQALRPGETTDLHLRGANLSGATGLWTGIHSEAVLAPDVAENGTKSGEVVYRVTVGADVHVGVHGLRVTTPAGTSAIELIAVDDLPSVAGQANTTLAKPQALEIPVAVDGHIASLGRNYFKFNVKAGQRLSFEVLARRMGSPLDPLIRLLDSEGRELTYSDDALGLSADAQLSYTFNAAGEYLLELRDIRWQGGGNYRYRLRIGDFPCVAVPFPMAAKRGSDVEIAFAGSHLDDLGLLQVKVPSDPKLQWMNVGAKRAGGRSSGFAVLAISDGDEFVETEPNDASESSNRVNFPANMNGRLNKPRDVDHYVFTAKKGQKVLFTAVTRTQGSPADLYMRLLDASGKRVAEAEDAGMNDGAINFTFPADGDYTLVVDDLHRRGGSDFAYRIAVSEPTAGFTLQASTDRLNVPAGGLVAVTVDATRTNFKGPIAISAVDLPPGVTSMPTTLGGGQKSVVLTVQAAADTEAGKLFPVRVVGTATINGAEYQSEATISAALKEALAKMPYPPQVLAKAAALAVAPKPGFVLRTQPDRLVFGRDLQATLKVTAERAEGFEEEIKLAVRPAKNGLPSGISAAVKPIPKGKNEVEIVFSANAKAALGEFTGVLEGTTKKEKTTVTQPSPGVGLKLDVPLKLTAHVAEGTLAKGGELKIKASVERNPALPGPVAITIQNLPKGVTAAKAEIPADQTEVEIPLTAGEDAAVGTADKVTLSGAVTAGKKTFSATSSAVALTVE